MDNSDFSRNRHNEHLGVNKNGKNIRKSPVHQPNFANSVKQPQVYNINKNDFRNVVQRLTGSPSPSHHSQEPILTRPPQNSSSMRLQRIRPPSLAPINVNRPQMPAHFPPGGVVPRPVRYGQPPPQAMVPPPMAYGDHTGRANTMESPISAYMRYLQHSIADSPQQASPQFQQHRPHVQSQTESQPPLSSGLLPHPHVPPLPSPRMSGPPLVSPRVDGFPPLLPSPTAQFFIPSPSGYLNLLSPRSPYPLLSPAYQYPPPLTPNFSFSPMAQSGILGPGPQPPPSPGMGFPFSPGFFQFSSPRWRD